MRPIKTNKLQNTYGPCRGDYKQTFSTPMFQGKANLNHEIVAEHCRDVKDAAARKGFSKFTKNKSDEEKAKDRADWFEKDMSEMLGKIEEAVSETSEKPGYSFGSELSYGDVAIWALLRDCFKADLEDTEKACAECSVLNAIADQVASNSGVSKWIDERPASMF